MRGREGIELEAGLINPQDRRVGRQIEAVVPVGIEYLRDESDVLRIVVEDGGKRFRFEPATFDNQIGERHLGLQLVDRLSDGWGLSLDGKKAVWFEIALR